MTRPLLVEDLHRMAYDAAFALQRQVHQAVRDGQQADTLLLVEHDPVITISKRQGADRHILADATRLAAAGVALCPTNRGGDVTYHGPGQIVAYPIINLNQRGLNLRQYVWLLEQAIIDTVGEFGIDAHRDECAVGVWVGQGKAAAKIAAIGVRAERWVTLHGLALNVTTHLDHFNLIIPCGLVGRSVTSMQQQLGNTCPATMDVQTKLIQHLQRHLANPDVNSNLPAR